MMYMVGAKDGSFRTIVAACSLDEALEEVAHKFEYANYQAMRQSLGYTTQDLIIAALVDDRGNTEHRREAIRPSALAAFKWLRRGRVKSQG